MLKQRGESLNTLGDEYFVHPSTVSRIFKEFSKDSEKKRTAEAAARRFYKNTPLPFQPAASGRKSAQPAASCSALSHPMAQTDSVGTQSSATIAGQNSILLPEQQFCTLAEQLMANRVNFSGLVSQRAVLQQDRQKIPGYIAGVLSKCNNSKSRSAAAVYHFLTCTSDKFPDGWTASFFLICRSTHTPTQDRRTLSPRLSLGHATRARHPRILLWPRTPLAWCWLAQRYSGSGGGRTPGYAMGAGGRVCPDLDGRRPIDSAGCAMGAAGPCAPAVDPAGPGD